MLQTDNKNLEPFHTTELDFVFEKVPQAVKSEEKINTEGYPV